jgi:hypothetical protein
MSIPMFVTTPMGHWRVEFVKNPEPGTCAHDLYNVHLGDLPRVVCARCGFSLPLEYLGPEPSTSDNMTYIHYPPTYGGDS